MEPTVDNPISTAWILQLIDIAYIALGIVINVLTSQVPTFFDSVIGQLFGLFQPATSG